MHKSRSSPRLEKEVKAFAKKHPKAEELAARLMEPRDSRLAFLTFQDFDVECRFSIMLQRIYKLISTPEPAIPAPDLRGTSARNVRWVRRFAAKAGIPVISSLGEDIGFKLDKSGGWLVKFKCGGKIALTPHDEIVRAYVTLKGEHLGGLVHHFCEICADVASIKTASFTGKVMRPSEAHARREHMVFYFPTESFQAARKVLEGHIAAKGIGNDTTRVLFSIESSVPGLGYAPNPNKRDTELYRNFEPDHEKEFANAILRMIDVKDIQIEDDSSFTQLNALVFSIPVFKAALALAREQNPGIIGPLGNLNRRVSAALSTLRKSEDSIYLRYERMLSEQGPDAVIHCP